MSGYLFSDDLAYSLFGTDMLRVRARHLMRAHPRARDYLVQAPIIVLASLQFSHESVTFVMKDHCERGSKLGVVLDAFKINRGLRRIKADALSYVDAETLAILLLRDANPSAIAQQVAARRDPENQRRWLIMLDRATRSFPDQFVVWLAENKPFNGGAIFDLNHLADFLHLNHLADFLRGQEQWTPDWTWQRLLTELRKWEESFARAKQERLATYNEPLTPHEGVPKEWRPKDCILRDYTFRLLNTRNELIAEGAQLHHCVGGYGDRVKSGVSLIYACSLGGERIGTLEFVVNGVVEVNQFKSHNNGSPRMSAWQAATDLCRELNELEVADRWADDVIAQYRNDQQHTRNMLWAHLARAAGREDQ